MDWQLFEDMLVPWVTIFSLVLLLIAGISYNRTRNNRLLFVTIAFALFFAKGVLLTIGLYAPQVFEAREDPAIILVDIMLLLAMYFGVLRKDKKDESQAERSH